MASSGSRSYRNAGISLLAVIVSSRGAMGYELESRWGHASTYIPSPPALLIHGGKTGSGSGSSFTASPNSRDTILIPLDGAFSTSSPPAALLQSTDSPAYAFHTLSTVAGSGSTWDIMAFGGDAGSSEATQTQSNSAWQGKVDTEAGTASYTREGTGSQPMRRLYHSAAGPDGNGRVYLTGGLKGDGSGQTFSDAYAYDPASSSFSPLPNLPQGMYHHNSLLLNNGTLVVAGGLATSQNTGNGAVVPMSSVYVMDTSSNSPVWEERSVSGTAPDGRRGATLVTNKDGNKAFMFGGADASLAEGYGDGWELDLDRSSWQKMEVGSGGAGPRFSHSAANLGNDQVLIFGGYGQGGPADPTVYIWDTAQGAWTDSFQPPSASSPNQEPSAQASAGSAIGSQSGNPSAPSQTNAKGEPAGSSDGNTNNPSSSTSPQASASAESSNNGPFLTTPVMVALIIGSVAIAGVLIGGLLYRYRRKQRRKALLGAAAWNGGAGGGNRPYGSREKGGEGLMDESNEKDLPDAPYRSPIFGLGMGAIGASLASISSKLGARRHAVDPYAELADEGQYIGGPMRRSTRREGNGIRLIGPRPSTSSSRYTPVRLADPLGRRRSSISAVREDRVDMLHDEDSRRFAPIQEEDWVMSQSGERGRWTSARSILGPSHVQDDSDPFSDDEDDDSLLAPPLRGGPVPTPHASRSDLDPFDDYNRRTSYLSPFEDSDNSGLSPPPPLGGFSETSLPRSQRSGFTGESSDMEEGIVHHAQMGSQTSASILSPAETAYVPIKRSESFFRRMAQGGITSLLSRQPSQRETVRELNVRDPNPVPALWPIDSRDEPSSPDTASPTYPPSAFKGGLTADNAHGKGPSLSSLQSARSMRDMVIVQREPSASTAEEEGIIECRSPSPEPDFDGPILAALPPITHHRHGQTAATDSLTSLTSPPRPSGSETPGEVIFNGAEFSSPARSSPKSPETTPKPLRISTSSHMDDFLATPTRSISADQSAQKSEPPSGSPVPSPLVSHRRPVRDVVNSINKRGGGVPLGFSPASAYSPSVTAPSSPLGLRPGILGRSDSRARPMTMYEAVKRERLLVANPDNKGRLDRTSSG